MRKRWEYLEFTDNLYPPIRHGFLQYAYKDSIAFHDYARHVRSSQIFCFNVLYPIISQTKLEEFIIEKLSLENYELSKWHFEYQPEKNYLGEWRGKQKPIDYITSVDFVAFLTSKVNNAIIAVFIEVKFSEENFSKCGGFTSNGNDNKSFCRKSFDINDVNNQCYLIKNKGRKYFDLTKYLYNNYIKENCPFSKNNQCQRNHALAVALKNDNIIDRYFFGLLYHDDNDLIFNEWINYKSQCTQNENENLFEIKASEIVGISNDPIYRKYHKDRYLIKHT